MSKITEFAKNQTCTLMWPGCMYDTEGAVVLCHAPFHPDKGWAHKAPDEWGLHACTPCHQILDGPRSKWPPDGLVDVFRGMAITQKRLKQAGLMEVAA